MIIAHLSQEGVDGGVIEDICPTLWSPGLFDKIITTFCSCWRGWRRNQRVPKRVMLLLVITIIHKVNTETGRGGGTALDKRSTINNELPAGMIKRGLRGRGIRGNMNFVQIA